MAPGNFAKVMEICLPQAKKYCPGKSKQFFHADCRLLSELFFGKSVNIIDVFPVIKFYAPLP